MAGAGYKLFNTGDVLTAAQVNTYLQEQTVMVFADAAARTTALSGVLAEGMITYLKSTDAVEVYNGSAWVNVTSDQTPLTTKGDLFTYSTADARLAVGNNGETLVADSSATTGLRWQSASNRNLVVNGAADFWQRGTSISTGATFVYTADRWRAGRGGFTAGTTISRQATGDTTNLPNIQYCMRWQRDSGNTSTQDMRLGMNLESSESIPFAGQTVVLSFYARKSSTWTDAGSDVGIFLYSGTGTDEGSMPSTTFTGNATVTSSTPVLTTTWQRFSLTGTVSASATQLGIYMTWVPVGTAGANDYIEMTGFQLELGSVPTTFKRAGGTLAGELSLCQRYYEKSFPIGTAPANSVGGGPTQGGAAGWIAYDANNVRSMPILFKVNKRTSPTITTYNTSDIATAGKWAYYTGSAWADAGGNSGVNINETGFYVTGNNSGAYTQHRPYLLAGNWTAEAEL